MKRLFAALALVTVMIVGFNVDPASAQPPAANTLCDFIAETEIVTGQNAQVLFAQYEVLTTSYVQARCLTVWYQSGSDFVCGFYARYYSSGAWAGPYSLQCDEV